MGSLASRPKAPPVARTVYVPVYSAPSTVTPAPVPAVPSPEPSLPQDTSTTPQAIPTDQAKRNTSLLDRRRGVLSTIVTGFRGVLSQTSSEPRKTLLGE